MVRAGRVAQERLIRERTHVTVGADEKSVFVTAARDVPRDFRLFELVGNEYALNFRDGMSGRVAVVAGVWDLRDLKARARRTGQGTFQVRLSDDSRGKIVIGDDTFLFQFVIPPPQQPRPQLPLAVYRGATPTDWPTTIIAAVAFLVHFLAVGALYSDWLDPIVDRELEVAGLVETVKSLPPPPPIEDEPTEPEETPAKARTDDAAKKPASKARGGRGPDRQSTREAAALSEELDRLKMATLGALIDGGPATAEVLRRGEVPMDALDAAASSAAGVAMGGLDFLGGGGAIRPGHHAGLQDVGNANRSGGTEGAGTLKGPRGPKGVVVPGQSSTRGGRVSNAASVVATMRPGFRHCYNRALQEDPDARGSIDLSIRVGPGGEVQGVAAVARGSLPATLVSCVKARAGAAEFAPPEGGSALVQVPVTFVKQ